MFLSQVCLFWYKLATLSPEKEIKKPKKIKYIKTFPIKLQKSASKPWIEK